MRIISGPSVAIVNATPCSTKAPECLAYRGLVGQRLREQVRRRADLEHGAGLAQEPHQLGVAGGQDPVADPLGTQALDDLADLLGAGLALLADVDRDPETGRSGGLDHRRDLAES